MDQKKYFICKNLKALLSIDICNLNKTKIEISEISETCPKCNKYKEFQNETFSLEEIINNQQSISI